MKTLYFLCILLTSNILCANASFVLKFKSYDSETIKEYQENYNLKPYFSLSPDKLLELKKSGEKSGQKLADLRTYFRVKGDQELFLKLKGDSSISLIYKDIKNIPDPVISIDISPATPRWETEQGYLYSFEEAGGLHPKYAWRFEGGKGELVTIVDIESGWTHDHEDLGIEDINLYDAEGGNLTGTPKKEDFHHGTAVLGQMVGIRNAFGVTGMAHQATMKAVNQYTHEYGYSVADAIVRGISVLEIGSVFLLEAQKAGPNYEENQIGSQFGLVPVEWYPAEFDAIKTATANGFIVVEAGANGEQNLDDPVYHSCTGDINTYFSNQSGKEPCFDIETRDSGAIIVGAGNPPNGEWGTPRAKMYYTSFGKRIDVQAWGMSIYTTGYGDLFFPGNDIKQAYTTNFGGTSGASPMITSVAALIQSRYKALNENQTLTSQEIRDIIKNPQHSNPQAGNSDSEHIGPQPDLELIFKHYFHDMYIPCDPSCDTWKTCNTLHGLCELNEGKCDTNADCTLSEVCDHTHSCVDPCEHVACNEWESCQGGACLLNADRCKQNDTCPENTYCNIGTHRCEDPCDALTCSEHATCMRQNNNEIADCVCDSGYQKNNENNCIAIKKESASCQFSDGKVSIWSSLIFFFFIFLFLFSKKANTLK